MITEQVVKRVELKPLDSKYYSTELSVEFVDGDTVHIELSGYSPKPSLREIERGWEPECGMDHVESEKTYYVATLIRGLLEAFG